jgi:hypothetical protein
MKTKLSEIMEGQADMNERDFEKDLETVVAEDFVAPTMPSLTEMKAAVPQPPAPTSTFHDYARASMRLRRAFQHETVERHNRGQSPLADWQQEALHRIAADIASILSYDPNDTLAWDSISGNAQLGKG